MVLVFQKETPHLCLFGNIQQLMANKMVILIDTLGYTHLQKRNTSFVSLTADFAQRPAELARTVDAGIKGKKKYMGKYLQILSFECLRTLNLKKLKCFDQALLRN